MNASVNAQSLTLIAPPPHESAQTILQDDSGVATSSHVPAFINSYVQQLVIPDTDVAQGDSGTTTPSHDPAFVVAPATDVVQSDSTTPSHDPVVAPDTDVTRKRKRKASVDLAPTVEGSRIRHPPQVFPGMVPTGTKYDRDNRGGGQGKARGRGQGRVTAARDNRGGSRKSR